jgi:lysozyme family protein
MATFDKAYTITLGHEGGYSNDPHDKGGETYMGVARNFYPNWEGWSIIDSAKSENGFPRNLSYKNKLTILVKGFYKENYWDKVGGDLIPDQSVANELFDTAVNMGVNKSIRFLQLGLNVLNRNQKNYSDVVEDGKFGNNTLTALNACLSLGDGHYLVKVMNILQGANYISIMKNNPTQQRFARGWLNRVEL